MVVGTHAFDLSGKTAMVTGAAGGLGQCFARTLSAAGASVVLCSRNKDRPELITLADELNATGQSSTSAGGASGRVGEPVTRLSIDVVSQASVDSAFVELDELGLSVDILVNNAGVAVSGEAQSLSPEAWNAVVDTNLRGAWTVSQQLAKRLIEQSRSGSIINIASILGLQPGKGTAPYAVSKAGLIQMTRALALEWARYNIRVNALSPGYIETDINRDFLQSDAALEQLKRIPTRRIGDASDLSGPLLLLASAAGNHMTGANIVVDGGHSCMSL